jgi:capsular exopolysaccharide synthesis family protein
MTPTRHDPLVLTPSNLNSHFAEAFRALRANISFSSIDRPVKTILVTSAMPREGKTMTTLNLGIIMGQAGPRVLIVDADLRHPSLHHLLEVSANGSSNGHRALPGLSNVIVGSSKLDDAIMPSQFPNVSLICAGVLPPNPSELLASQRMRAFVNELNQRADIVLLDSPPCLLYADAFVLSQIADGVLYVLRSGAQDKAAQRRVHKQFQQAKSRLLGVIFNDVEVEEAANTYAYYYPVDGKRRK